MKNFRIAIALFMAVSAAPLHAASDTDVTILNATEVVIGESTITISAEARTIVRIITGKHDPAYQGETLRGMPVSTIQTYSGNATFTINRPADSSEITANAWKMSLEAAESLKAGKEIGRIGYYQPDVTLRDNKVVSITGSGFIYPKGK